MVARLTQDECPSGGQRTYPQKNRPARTPAPAGGEEKLLVGGMLLWLIAFPLLPHWALLLSAPFVGVSTVFALWRHHGAASYLGIFCSLCIVTMLLGATSSQIFLGLGIIGYILIIRATPWLRGMIGWLRLGQLDRTVVALSVGFVALSGVALVL